MTEAVNAERAAMDHELTAAREAIAYVNWLFEHDRLWVMSDDRDRDDADGDRLVDLLAAYDNAANGLVGR